MSEDAAGRPFLTYVSEKTLGACVKAARDYSARHNVRLFLRVTKIAVAGETRLGDVTPGHAVMGQWRFSGSARW